MNIVVCIKQVPGTSRVEVDEKTGVLKREGVDSKMNPYDLYALEAALRIKEQKTGTVTAVSMGPPQAEAILNEAFMMGADAGVLLSDRRFAGSDVLATAYTIAQGIKQCGQTDLIICGKQTTDGDTAQVGPEIAEYLGLPHLTNIKKLIEINEAYLIAEIDLGDVLQTAKISLPCVVTVEKDIFEPRLPSFLQKLASANRKIKTLSMDDFSDSDDKKYGLNGSPTQVERIFPPAVNSERELWQGDTQELVSKLHDKLRQLRVI